MGGQFWPNLCLHKCHCSVVPSAVLGEFVYARWYDGISNAIFGLSKIVSIQSYDHMYGITYHNLHNNWADIFLQCKITTSVFKIVFAPVRNIILPVLKL